MQRSVAFTSAILTLACAASASAAPIQWRFSDSINYTSGDYGDALPTEVWSMPMTVRASSGRWAVRATIPYLSISGPTDIALIDDGEAGGAGSPSGSPGFGSSTRSGLGDTTVAASYNLRRMRGTAAYLTLTGQVRVPTGDEANGLGVGVFDYGLNGEFGGDWRKGGVYVNLGRRFLGDSNTTIRQDGWTASTGGWIYSGKSEYGAYVSWRESPYANGQDPAEAGAYIAYRVDRNWRLRMGGLVGLNDASPNYGASLGFSYRITPERN